MENKTVLIFLVGLFLLSMVYSGLAQKYALEGVVVNIKDVEYDPTPARAGDYIDLFLTVSNGGSTTGTDVNFQLITGYPFSLTPDQNATQQISSLYLSSPRTLQYRLMVDNNAQKGNNTMKLKYWQGPESNPVYSGTLEFDIFVQASSNLIISEVRPTTINPGSQTDVIFRLSNEGGSPVKNLLFEWESTNNLILPIGSDNKKYVPSIDIGKSEDVKFKLMADPNLAPGVYPLTIKLTSQNANWTTKVGMIVGGGTDFDIGVDSVIGGEISLSISNVGVNSVESVSVKLGDETKILGNLNKGDFSLATFRNILLVPSQLPDGGQGPNRGGNRSVRNFVVEISYTDTTGQRQMVTKELPISQIVGFRQGDVGSVPMGNGFSGRQLNRTGGGSNTIIIVIVLAIVIIGGFYFFRKRRNKRKDEI